MRNKEDSITDSDDILYTEEGIIDYRIVRMDANDCIVEYRKRYKNNLWKTLDDDSEVAAVYMRAFLAERRKNPNAKH